MSLVYTHTVEIHDNDELIDEIEIGAFTNELEARSFAVSQIGQHGMDRVALLEWFELSGELAYYHEYIGE